MLDIPSDTVRHDYNKHSLTADELSAVFEAVRQNKIKEAYLGDYQRHSGTPVKMSIDVNGVEYGLSFEHLRNGRNILGTVFKLTDKTWLKKKEAQANPSYPDSKSRPLGHSFKDIIGEIRKEINTSLEQRKIVRRGAVPPVVLRQQKGKRRVAEQAAGRNETVYEGITLENRKGMCL